MLNLKEVNKQIRNKLIDTENKLMVASGRKVGGRGEKGESMKKYKLTVIKTAIEM